MTNQKEKICSSKVFKELYKTHAKELKRYLYFKYGELETAEDVVQDAFIKLWDNCEKIPYAKANNFLFTVANNLFLNVLKRRGMMRKHNALLKNTNEIESPDFIMEGKEFQLKLEKVIADLPEKQKVVFLMSRMEKKKYREIAEVLGITVKAVEKRMHKALLLLKDKIGKV